MNKFGILKREYKGTTVIEGSATLFAVYFWLTKFFSFFQQHSELLNTVIHKIAQYLPQPEFVIQNNSGIFVVKPFDDSTVICSDYFEANLRSWLQHPKEKDIFVDIGANRGLYTVLSLTKYGYTKAYAFEPNPDVVKQLKKNIVLNNISGHAQVHAIGLGALDETVSFSVDEMHKGGGRIEKQSGISTLTISTKPLDKIFNDVDTTRISFIKIDTEGYEFEILDGAAHTLRAMPISSSIMIESADFSRVSMILTAYGFIHEASINYRSPLY